MTRVYYDAGRRALFLEGVSTAFAPKSLTYIRTGDVFEIWLAGAKRLMMGTFLDVSDGAGIGFADANATAAYLDGIFAIDPFGTANTYTHIQSAASDTWTVNHNLGYRADVSLTTLGGAEFEAEVVHVSTNQCVVSLVSPLAGQARCT